MIVNPRTKFRCDRSTNNEDNGGGGGGASEDRRIIQVSLFYSNKEFHESLYIIVGNQNPEHNTPQDKRVIIPS